MTSDLAAAFLKQGEHAKAERYLRQVVAAHDRDGTSDPRGFNARMNLAVCVRDQGRLDEAAPMFVAVLKDARGKIPSRHWIQGIFRRGYAVLLSRQGKHAEAERHLKKAEQIVETALGTKSPRIAKVYEAFIELYEAWGKPELAEPYRKKLAAAKGGS